MKFSNKFYKNIGYKNISNFFSKVNQHIYSMNNSKLFAGLMIIILNISSKFVNIKLSKTMEAYLKYTFSKQILVFAMAWMGTRDIYIALLITIIFIIFTEFLFNEESRFCLLPESFTNYHIGLLEQNDDKIKKNDNNIDQSDVEKIVNILQQNGVNLSIDDKNIPSNVGGYNGIKM